MTRTLDRLIEEFLRGLIIAEVDDHIQVVTSLMGEGEAAAVLPRIVIQCQSQETPEFQSVGVHRIVTQISSIAEATSPVSSDDMEEMNTAVDRVIVFADNLPDYLSSQDVTTHGVVYGGETQEIEDNKLIRIRSAEIWSRLLNADPLQSQVPILPQTGTAGKVVTVSPPVGGFAEINFDGGTAIAFNTKWISTAQNITMQILSRGISGTGNQGFFFSTTQDGTNTDLKAAMQIATKSSGALGEILFVLNGALYIATPQGLSLLDDATAVAQLTTLGISNRGHLSGLTLSNNSGDATNDIDISEGVCRDSTDAQRIVLSGTLTKQLDAAWAVGTNQGGLDTGAVGNNTYHVWAIKRSDTGVCDVLFSLSATAPTMPTNYDFKRRIGSIMRVGGAIVLFTQMGNQFLRMANIMDVNVANLGTTAVLYALSVPTGIKVSVLATFLGQKASAQPSFLVTSPDQTDSAVDSNNRSFFGASSSGWGMFSLPIRTNTSAQIRARADAASCNFQVLTTGWIDTRED